ncbi:MAG: hypothetical protein KIT09_21455 [Bryobacteraceae bacterium]|nr:hypothetical protein [Bryobacteraceae bacterium]
MLFGTALVAVPAFLLARAGGAPPRRTGGPGDLTCADVGCHTGTANSGPGRVEINFGSGQQYTPGEVHTWVVTITDPDARAWGFEVSSRPASNDESEQAGRFEPGQGAQVLCENDTQRQTNCPSNAPLEFITHTLPSDTNTFTFSWRAPDANVGDIRVFVAGNAANGNFTPEGDRIYTNSYTLTPAGATGAPSLRETNPVLQVWDGSAEISSGTWLELYGEDLSNATRQWTGDDFDGDQAPTELEGVRVEINGKPAFVSYVSPTQVNVQAPDDDATGPVTVELTNEHGTSNVVSVDRVRISPALLTTPAFHVDDRQYLAAVYPGYGTSDDPDFGKFVGRANLIEGAPFRPARPGETIILYAVGCGPTEPESEAGRVPADIRSMALPFEIRFGETVAEAQGYLVAQTLGLYQFNVTVPNVPTGDIAIDLIVDGVATGQTLFTTIGE